MAVNPRSPIHHLVEETVGELSMNSSVFLSYTAVVSKFYTSEPCPNSV